MLIFVSTNNEKQNKMKTEFPKYRLINQKSKGYKGLYKKLFTLLNKDLIFGECFEESMSYDGEDVILETTWEYEGQLPKGIIRID